MQNINIGDSVIISAEYLASHDDYPYQRLEVTGISNGIILSKHKGRDFYFPIEDAIKVNKQ